MVVGCASDDGSQQAEEDPVEPDVPDVPLTDEDIVAVCNGTTFADAPPYAGTAVPRLPVVLQEEGADDRLLNGPDTSVIIGGDNDLPPESWRLVDGFEDVPVVACARYHTWGGQGAPVVKQCRGYTSGSTDEPLPPIDMFQNAFDITLHEVRSGRSVENVTMQATNESCPYSILSREGTGGISLQVLLTEQDWINALGHHVAPS